MLTDMPAISAAPPLGADDKITDFTAAQLAQWALSQWATMCDQTHWAHQAYAVVTAGDLDTEEKIGVATADAHRLQVTTDALSSAMRHLLQLAPAAAAVAAVEIAQQRHDAERAAPGMCDATIVGVTAPRVACDRRAHDGGLHVGRDGDGSEISWTATGRSWTARPTRLENLKWWKDLAGSLNPDDTPPPGSVADLLLGLNHGERVLLDVFAQRLLAEMP